MEAPLQLLVTNLDYDEHKGRIAIGRVQSGTVRKGDNIVFTKPGASALGRMPAAPPGGVLLSGGAQARNAPQSTGGSRSGVQRGLST